MMWHILAKIFLSVYIISKPHEMYMKATKKSNSENKLCIKNTKNTPNTFPKIKIYQI